MIRFLSLKTSVLSLSCCLIVISFTGAYAAAGCCSHHGGVKGCNQITNHLSCKDGTDSPSCLCSGGKTKQIKAKQVSAPSTTSKTSKTSTATTPAPVTATPTTSTTAKSTKGCCSKHGGVDKCDTATGYLLCKDGTHSTTCKCP